MPDTTDDFYRPAIDKVHARLLQMLEAAKAAPRDADDCSDADGELITALAQIQTILDIPDVPLPSFDELQAGATLSLF